MSPTTSTPTLSPTLSPTEDPVLVDPDTLGKYIYGELTLRGAAFDSVELLAWKYLQNNITDALDAVIVTEGTPGLPGFSVIIGAGDHSASDMYVKFAIPTRATTAKAQTRLTEWLSESLVHSMLQQRLRRAQDGMFDDIVVVMSILPTIVDPSTTTKASTTTDPLSGAESSSDSSDGLGTGGTVAVVLLAVILVFGALYYGNSFYKKTQSNEKSPAVYTNPELDLEGSSTVDDPASIEDGTTVAKLPAQEQSRERRSKVSLVAPTSVSDNVIFSVALQPSHASLNRYKDIYPYDTTRVALANAGYINASLCGGETDALNRFFIAAQGPTRSSTPHFWQMVWEYNCTTIVALTGLIENDHEKCSQYWPSGRGHVEDIGNFSIAFTNEHRYAQSDNITIREFTLHNKIRQTSRKIMQLHFTAWADLDVPRDVGAFHRLVLSAERCQKGSAGPMVVHGSAGVGRTGVFITVVDQMRAFASRGDADVFGKVVSLRKQRPHMVQTAQQYAFAHDALIHVIQKNVGLVAPNTSSTEEVQDFLERYVNNSKDTFDLGAPGREILRVGSMNLLTRTKGKLVTIPSKVAVCNDVIVVTIVHANGDYELFDSPIDRNNSKAVNVQEEWDESILKLSCGKTTYTLECKSDDEKLSWINQLNSQSTHHASSSGSKRSLPAKPSSRKAVLAKLGMLDPKSSSDRAELNTEWETIPLIFDNECEAEQLLVLVPQSQHTNTAPSPQRRFSLLATSEDYDANDQQQEMFTPASQQPSFISPTRGSFKKAPMQQQQNEPANAFEILRRGPPQARGNTSWDAPNQARQTVVENPNYQSVVVQTPTVTSSPIRTGGGQECTFLGNCTCPDCA